MESVEDIMTSNDHFCSSGESLLKISQFMMAKHCSEIIVINNEDDRQPVGIVTEHDIVSAVAEGLNMNELLAVDCMHSLPLTVNSRMNIEDCLGILERNKLEHASVIDAEGRYCGEIAKTDIVGQFNE